MAVRIDRDKLLKALAIPAVGQATVVVASKTSRKAGIADYRCDGVDDQEEINKAIADVLAVGGGTVYLMEGEYKLRFTKTVVKDVSIPLEAVSRLCIRGAGRGKTKLVLDQADIVPILITSGSSNVAIRDLEIDGALITQPSGLIVVYGTTNLLLENLYLHHARDPPEADGMHIDGCERVQIVNCVIHDGMECGMHLYYSKEVVVMGNHVYNCDEGGIEVDVYPPEIAERIVIANNVVRNVTWGAINLDSATGAPVRGVRDVIIANNQCLLSEDGIRCLWFSGYPSPAFSGVVIVGNLCKDNTRDGIHLTECDDFVVQGNRCTGNGGYGIRETTGGDYNLIVGNNCRGNTTGAISTVGVNTIVANNMV